MKYVPRYYQSESVDAVFDAWKRGIQRPGLVLATGTGKTVIFAMICSALVREHRRRPLVLVHRDELVDQAVEKLRESDPGLTVGIIKAELHQVNADVVVASVQSLVRRLGVGKRPVSVERFTDVVVDECHHAAAASYMKILKFFGCFDPESDSRALGVTATMARADGIPLGGVWQEVVYEYSTVQGMEDKYLVPAHAERVVLKELDLSKIKSTAGDWRVEELGGTMYKSGARIAEVLLEKGRDPFGRIRRTIVFAPTVQCAQFWAEDFVAAGIRCRIVTGETPKPFRKKAYEDTAEGLNDALISVMVLTEGFDLPSVEVAIIGRPTKSITLYTQMVGRVLRRSEETGKTCALVLDVCGVVSEKLRTLIDLGLPPACDCACDCELAHLCPLGCNCPRDKKGKLKKPCLICARAWVTQPKEERERCPHYQGGHVRGCRHRCEGLGRPGPHEPDEIATILDPEEPDPEELVIDESSIETTGIDLWERKGGRAKHVAAKRPPKPKAWRTTEAGRPYLPPTQHFEYYIFLHQFPDGSWSVGEKPSKGGGRAKELAKGLTFAGAVLEAEDSHPYGGKLGRPLIGIATEGQLGTLQRNQIEIPPGCSKQQASELLDHLFASRSLD